jgi:hypothetical protein
MTKHKNGLTSVSVATVVGTLILACSSSSPAPTPITTGNNPTPPGTTAVGSAPYAICQPVYLGFTTANGASYATPATTPCTPAGTPTAGAADAHCAGQTPVTPSGAACGVTDAGPPPSDDAGPAPGDDAGDAGGASADAGPPPPAPGPCGENSTDYGATMFGTSGNDDDCKYHVAYTSSPICQNNGTYFVVTATYLGSGKPVTGAATQADLCLSDTHPAPAINAQPPTGKQQVVEGPPGTYTVGPVQFDAPGDWTVRFHFNEFCCDTEADSPHGHAAFHLTVP